MNLFYCKMVLFAVRLFFITPTHSLAVKLSNLRKCSHKFMSQHVWWILRCFVRMIWCLQTHCCCTMMLSNIPTEQSAHIEILHVNERNEGITVLIRTTLSGQSNFTFRLFHLTAEEPSPSCTESRQEWFRSRVMVAFVLAIVLLWTHKLCSTHFSADPHPSHSSSSFSRFFSINSTEASILFSFHPPRSYKDTTHKERIDLIFLSIICSIIFHLFT